MPIDVVKVGNDFLDSETETFLKEKYVNMKKERDKQAKIAEDKKNGRGSKYHPCAQAKK